MNRTNAVEKQSANLCKRKENLRSKIPAWKGQHQQAGEQTKFGAVSSGTKNAGWINGPYPFSSAANTGMNTWNLAHPAITAAYNSKKLSKGL